MKHSLAVVFLFGIAACGPEGAVQSDSPEAAGDALVQYDWPHYANTLSATKYANLDQINPANVASLQTVWTWDAPDNAFLSENSSASREPGLGASSGFKSTPIMIGRTLYISTPIGFVAALDAVTGEQNWVFDTKTYEHGRPANIGFNHRGVAYYEHGDKRRVLMGTNNAFLWSLDADTGLPDKSFGDNGRVDLTLGMGREIDRSKYSNTAAVTIVDDVVVMGSVISDMPLPGWYPEQRTDMPPGHIRGFDVNTGEQKWMFHSIPQPGEVGHETWENDSWTYTGSTNVWTLMSADPDLGYVYLPFGAATNDWYGGERLGDNLFANSIVCLDARTGELVWYFQTVHHDLWDYDLPAAPNLVDITVDGRDIKALAQVSKQGFVYVLDRVTGKPVWPIEERPVPQSDVPGERTSPTQPFPTRPAPFDVQGLTESDLIDFTPELRAAGLESIKRYRNDGLFTPPSLVGSIQVPSDGGGAEWMGAAFDPATAMLYVPSTTAVTAPRLAEPEPGTADYRYIRSGNRWLRGPKRLPLMKPPYGRISAIDLNTGEYVWVVPNAEGRDVRRRLMDMGIADPGPVGVGLLRHTAPLVTKSLLLIAVQDDKPYLRAFDKRTGDTIAEIELPAPPMGAPMTYMVDGRQYISIASMAGPDGARLVTLALPLPLPLQVNPHD